MSTPGMAIRSFGRSAAGSPKQGAGVLSPFSPLQSKSLVLSQGRDDPRGRKKEKSKKQHKRIGLGDASGAVAGAADGAAAAPGGAAAATKPTEIMPGWTPVQRASSDRKLEPIDAGVTQKLLAEQAERDAARAAAVQSGATVASTASNGYNSLSSNGAGGADAPEVPGGASLNDKADAGGAGGVPVPKRSDTESDTIMSGYMWGQVANVGRFGVWWVALGPLVLALFNGSSYGVGGARVSYNVAMFLFSPIAGAMAERVAIRYLLNVTTTCRLVLYVLALPLAFVLFRSGWVWNNDAPGWESAFYVVFLSLMFVDGMMIAFANVVDIDCGGTDLIAAQYSASVNDALRNKFNSIHEMFFNLSMIVFAPFMAWVALYAVQHWNNAQDAAAIGGTLAFVFLVLSLVSLYQYNVHIPRHTTPVAGGKLKGGCVSCGEASSVWADMRSGMLIVWRSHRIRWRIIFLALETACEDAMVSLVIAEYAIAVLARSSHTGDGDIDFAKGNLLAAAVVACGKLGAILSGFVMNRVWASTLGADGKASDASFKPLFYMVFAGGLSSLLLPIGNMLATEHGDSPASYALVFIGSFLFFLFSTAPKIGFGTLMQSLAAEVDASGRIFGFITCVITATDSLVLLAFSLLFSMLSLDVSMWLCCGLIALHGLCEVLLGPWLVLGSPANAATTVPAGAANAAAGEASSPSAASSGLSEASPAAPVTASDRQQLQQPLLSVGDDFASPGAAGSVSPAASSQPMSAAVLGATGASLPAYRNAHD